jgi:M6 family metalloprotease-like protein
MKKGTSVIVFLLLLETGLVFPVKPSERPGQLHDKTGCARTALLPNAKANVPGSSKGLVLLIEFEDTPYSLPDPKNSFLNLLNQSRYRLNGARGSARDYFIDNSDSLYFPAFDVYGPVRLQKGMKYYGENGENGEELHAAEMIVEACRHALDSLSVDFSRYDADGNRTVDMVYVFFASYCENENRTDPNYIWSHAGTVPDSLSALGDMRISRYACSSELRGTPPDKNISSIGTVCHEFSHVLGLPDFYNTRSGSGITPNQLSVMDRGNYLDNGHCPAGYSSFEREMAGWMDVPAITASRKIVLAPVNRHITAGNDTLRAFKIRIPDTGEAFYFENRQPEGWDSFLPSTGMFIFHVDGSNKEAWEKNEVNTDYRHPNYELVRAGGKYSDDTGASFPNGVDLVIDSQILQPWNGADFPFIIKDIHEEGGFIHLTVQEPR